MPPHLVIDGFLPDELHDALLEHALGQEAALTRSGVRQYGVRERGDYRRSWVSPDGFGVLQERFRAAILEALPVLFEQLRMLAFEPAGFEIELSAHRDGDYFRPHIDTLTGSNRDGNGSFRAITTVYYFHAQPRGFSGGEFAILPFGEGDPVLIDPRDNRLLALPAFARHEVLPISCQPDDFRSARFAVNAWVHRSGAAKAP